MDYGEVLSRAWKITWRFKALWVFGVLAACGRGGGGNAGQGFNYSTSPGDFPPEAERFFENLSQETLIAIVVALVLLVLFLALFFLVLGTVGQGGVIGGVDAADEGEAVTLRSAFQIAVDRFWPLLGIQLLLILAVLVFAGVVAVSVTLAGIATLGLALICLLPMLCLLIPLFIVAGMIVQISLVGCVVDELGALDALRNGWRVFMDHFGQMIVMGLILIFGGGVVGLLLGLPFLAIAVPAVSGLILGTQQALTTGLIIAGVCFVIYLPIAIVLNGALQTYIIGGWTLTYRRLTGRQPAAELA